jgi:nucleoside-diphosphate-sugar epimerase
MQGLFGCKVLVTGANGFLGLHLLQRLQQCKSIVHAISRSTPLQDCGAHWWRGDLRDGKWLQETVAALRPDVVFHLASASQGGQDVKFVLPTFENDLQTTINVLLALKTTGCSRLVLAASLEEPILDGRPITISSPYAAAKLAATAYGLMFHQLYKTPVTFLRPFMTYGPGQKHHKIVPYTITSLLGGRSPQLSSGVRPVDWVYVDDVISSFVAAAVRPAALGRVIDIGSGKVVSVRQVVSEIHQLMPGAPAPQLGALVDRASENVRCAETDTARSILGWEATTPLRRGLALTIESYRQELQPDQSRLPAGAQSGA